jgi:hypothetical protein
MTFFFGCLFVVLVCLVIFAALGGNRDENEDKEDLPSRSGYVDPGRPRDHASPRLVPRTSSRTERR